MSKRLNKNNRGCLLWICLSLCFLSFIPVRPTPHLDFLHIGTENGLSNDRIAAILQDSLGFIWIGTKHGLNRYDGANYKVYSLEKNDLQGNDISVLHIDKKNRLWVGTIGDGLYLYNQHNDSFERIRLDRREDNKDSYIEIHAILESSDSTLWIGTEAGLYSYDPLSATSELYKQEIEHSSESGKNNILAMIKKDEKIWIGTFGAGLYCFHLKTRSFEPFPTSEFSGLTIHSDYVNTLFLDHTDNLLVGTHNGLKLIDFEKREIVDYLAGTIYEGNTIIRCIKQEKTGELWIGTDGMGLLHIEKPSTSHAVINNYQNNQQIPHSLSCNSINTFYVDRQSNRWIGTAKKGIDIIKWELEGINSYYHDGEGKSKIPILAVFQDKNGFWMGTDGEGIARMDMENKEPASFTKQTFSGLGDFVQCIKPSLNGKYWIGTYEQGLYLFDPHTLEKRHIYREQGTKCSLPCNDVRDLVTLPSGHVWIATWGGGLVYLDTENWTTKSYKNDPKKLNSLKNDNILALHMDKKGRLWLATYGGGLICFDPETQTFQNFSSEEYPGLPSNFVFAFLAEDEDRLWVGTKDGLCIFDLQSFEFETIQIESDYAGRTIQSMLKDKEGNIWAGTKKGILHLQKGSRKVEFLPGIFDRFSLNAAHRDEYGTLYFGSDERVLAIHPSKIRFDVFKTPIYLTNLLLFNKPVSIGKKSVLKKQIGFEKEITLHHDQSVVTLEYATLDYPFSKNINYEVMLEGFETKWRNVSNQNTVTYTNLYPGQYTFKVRPVNDLFTKSETAQAQINIHVLPPFWQTWWAYSIYAVLLVFIFYLFRKYTLNWASIRNELKLEKLRREQEEHLHQLKQRFFINISHDIRTPLTLIASSVNKLFNKNESQLQERKNLMILKANTNRLLNLTEELLNYRKLETGNVTLEVSEENLVPFIQEIFLCYTQFALNKNIDYKFIHSEPEIYAWIDKVQLEKAICNLLSNAFKFTPKKGKISLEVTPDSDQIIIRVKDSGTGIAAEKVEHIFDRFYQVEKTTESTGFGIGLSITREIVHLHGGKIKIKSEVGRGSEFSVLLPKGKKHYEKVRFIESPMKDNVFLKPFTSEDENRASIPLELEEKENTVLIVEDNKEIRTYLAELLASFYHVHEVCNGQQALDISIEVMPDLIVSDVMMPVMDGITFCHKLKNDMRICHIPVILLTARTLVDSIVEGFETGADEYITKPFNEQILLARIKNILQNRKEIRQQICQEMILNPKDISLNTQDNIFLSKVMTFLEEHIGEPDLNIEQMAAEMSMSHSTLYKKMKALTGMTAIGFVKDFRLKRAAQLLTREELSITEIAYMVGYTERRHFSLDFKKMFNSTPKEYVETYKTNHSVINDSGLVCK